MLKVSRNNHPVIAFLLGLLSVNNILYAFVIGTTPIMTSCIYAVSGLIYLLLIHDENITAALHNIPQLLKIFLAFIILSAIPVAIMHYQYLYQWLVGVVQLLLYCSIILLVASLPNNQENLINGINLGILINFGFVVYAFLMYRQGVVFTLNDIFPAVHMKIMYIGNAFRGWGLFREPGHLMRYICILSFVTWEQNLKKPLFYRVVFLLSLVILVMFSISSAVFFFLIGIVIYLNLKGKRSLKVLFGSILGIIVLTAIAVIVAGRNHFISLLLSSFQDGVLDIFTTTGGNATRYSGFDYVLRIIKKYPIIGSGWNTLTQIFIEEGYYGVANVRGSYSEGLSLFAEMGIFCIPYLVFLYKSIIKTGRSQNLMSSALCTGLVLYMLLLFTTDYSIDAGASILIGLTILSIRMGDGLNESYGYSKKDYIS